MKHVCFKSISVDMQVILASVAARSSSRTLSLTLSRMRSNTRAVVVIFSSCTGGQSWAQCGYSCCIRYRASNRYRVCNIHAGSSSWRWCAGTWSRLYRYPGDSSTISARPIITASSWRPNKTTEPNRQSAHRPANWRRFASRRRVSREV